MTSMTLDTFLSLTKVIRMLYGRDVAAYFFEVNFTEFTGQDLDKFKSMVIARSN